MQLTRLSWAGVLVEHGEGRLVIDPLGRSDHLGELMGTPGTELISVGGLEADAALVTHRHPDHFDPRSLASVLAEDGVVFCPESLRREAQQAGLEGRGVRPGDSFSVGGFVVSAVHAVDGFGDDQVSWIVESDGTRVYHGGDTLWHGHWWSIAGEHGPVDVAFVPINGVRMTIPGLVPSGQPASMTPEQAAAAANLLGAGSVVPIHYGLFHDPDRYAEWPDAEATFLAEAEERDLTIEILRPGQTRTI